MCHYIRLSGGCHGFAEMSVREAAQAAIELGAVREVVARVSTYGGRASVFSISHFDENDEEVLYYSIGMETAQIFDPPRKVDDMYLRDYII